MGRISKEVRIVAIFLVLLLPILILGGKWWYSVSSKPQGRTERITAYLPRNGMMVDHRVSISGDGRWVAFSDIAQINGGPWSQGVMVYDRVSGKTMRISKGYDGSPENMTSSNPIISTNGRFVAYVSYSSNLIPADRNGTDDVYVYDLQEGKTSLVSVSTQGFQANAQSSYPSISEDGRYITFLSDASNLVPKDTNGVRDVFVHDCIRGETLRILAGTDDDQTNGVPFLPEISANGRFVVFYHEDPSHVEETGQYITRVVLYDRQNGDITRLAEVGQSQMTYHIPGNLSISGDGRFVIFPIWRNIEKENHLEYRQEWLLLDRQTGIQKPIMEGLMIADPAITPDGRYIVFLTGDTDLVKGDNNKEADIYVFDRKTGKYSRVSVSSYGDQGNRPATYPAISADGHHVVFVSDSRNLAAHDTNGAEDIFVRDLGDQHSYQRGDDTPPNGAPYPPLEFPQATPSVVYPYPPVEFPLITPTKSYSTPTPELLQLTPPEAYPSPIEGYP